MMVAVEDPSVVVLRRISWVVHGVKIVSTVLEPDVLEEIDFIECIQLGVIVITHYVDDRAIECLKEVEQTGCA